MNEIYMTPEFAIVLAYLIGICTGWAMKLFHLNIKDNERRQEEIENEKQ